MTFEEKFNDIRNIVILKELPFGFELKTPEGNIEFSEITYNPELGTISAFKVSRLVDEEISVDDNVSALYADLLKFGFKEPISIKGVDPKDVIVLRIKCRICGQVKKICVKKTDLELWQSDEPPFVQDCFPYLTPAERELLLTYTCSECFDRMFLDDMEDTEEEISENSENGEESDKEK